MDSSGDFVTNDFSSVTLSVTGGASLSSTCSGVESNGVVPFGDCSLNQAGPSFQLTATDASIGSPPTPFPAPNTVNVLPAPAAKLVFSPSTVTGTAIFKRHAGRHHRAGAGCVRQSTTTPLSVNLSSTSAGGDPQQRQGGPTSSVLTLNIGATGKATFFYGDTVAGNPMITAASNGLASATQVETITAGWPAKLAFTSSAFTAAQGTSASTPFTVSMEDKNGNVTSTQWNGSNGSSTTVTLSSSSATPKFAKAQGGTPTSTTLQVSIAANAAVVTAY